jgi:hypothetical protein
MFKELKSKKWLIWALAVVGEITLLLLVFRVGEIIGVHRADFSAEWGQNYGRFFGEPKYGFFNEVGELPPPIPAFGNVGTVLSVSGGQLVIQDERFNEKTVTVTSSTIIREGMNVITADKIPTGANIVIIGAPNREGAITARFIRIFPDESESSSTGN